MNKKIQKQIDLINCFYIILEQNGSMKELEMEAFTLISMGFKKNDVYKAKNQAITIFNKNYVSL